MYIHDLVVSIFDDTSKVVFYALISYTHVYDISGVLPPSCDVKQPAIPAFPASLASAALAASHASLRLDDNLHYYCIHESLLAC